MASYPVNPLTGEPFPAQQAAGGSTMRAALGYLVQAHTTGGAVTVQRPSPRVEGSIFAVVDEDGNAAANNITISGDGDLIDGQASLVLSQANALAALVYDSGQWRRLLDVRELPTDPVRGFSFLRDIVVPATATPALAGFTSWIDLQVGNQPTVETSFTRVGGRKIDMSPFPATIGAYTRQVRLLLDVDKSAGATAGDFQLLDMTHGGVLITGTNLQTVSNANEEKDSGALTVGSGAGNIRSDVATIYELQAKVTGGVLGVDSANITNARLVVLYL